ncbi:MAG: glycosyltransferase family 1 protein [Verrucomicrobia bacterium]|nr:glycosyltransferase family 1 protein [Verrucomicrobiota bacterium]
MGIVVGIDASRSRSGGARAHLIGILNAGNIKEHGIKAVHVWSYDSLLESLPTKDWLIKHSPKVLQGGLLRQVLWQRFSFPRIARKFGCDVVLNTDAGSVARFRPSVTMSRDALSYEPNEMKRYGLSKARLRLILLKYIQNFSLRAAEGSTFLTEYIANLIQKSTGSLRRIKVIPHGVGEEFRNTQKRSWPRDGEIIRLVYVSNIAPYKHQWMVVRAVSKLVQKGYNLQLKLVGSTDGGKAQALLDKAVAECDPRGTFVSQAGQTPNHSLPSLLSESDLFVFASSCETISNTLLEAMANGLPIACSNRGPMPEVLEDAGVYFDPEDAASIADAIEMLLADSKLRQNNADRVLCISKKYSWIRCADETWAFIKDTFEFYKNNEK